MRAACLICGSALERPATGRPPSYCGKACRGAARHERRRLDRRLLILETYAGNLRMMRDPDRQLGRVQAEIDQATDRLRALLAG